MMIAKSEDLPIVYCMTTSNWLIHMDDGQVMSICIVCVNSPMYEFLLLCGKRFFYAKK